MQAIRLTSEYEQDYKKFVAAHPSGSFLQSWSWGEFQSSQGKESVRYGIFTDSSNDRKLIATVQLLHTSIPRLPGSYLYAPYGPLITDQTTSKEVINTLLAQIRADFPKVWFVRMEPKDDLPIEGKPSLHIQPGSTLITDITSTEEVLLTAMHPKTRYNIKVAAKHGVAVQSEQIIDSAAIALLTETSARQKYKSYDDKYYAALLKFFADHQSSDCSAILYRANYQDICVASAIVIDHGTTRTYLFGGSETAHKKVMAPYALHWRAMQDAKAKGLHAYDWWGAETASGATPGFVQFKLRWAVSQKFYGQTRDIIFNSRWYFVYTALRKINRFM